MNTSESLFISCSTINKKYCKSNDILHFQGLCHQIAVEQGIRHAQLPLDKYVNMKTRKVLTIDHGTLMFCLNYMKNHLIEIGIEMIKIKMH